MVIVCFLTVLGGEFLKYMEAFKPFLGIGLKNYAEYQVGSAKIQLTTELCGLIVHDFFFLINKYIGKFFGDLQQFEKIRIHGPYSLEILKN